MEGHDDVEVIGQASGDAVSAAHAELVECRRRGVGAVIEVLIAE
jgi:hypothetical protein